MAGRALEGIRVLDASQMMAGPVYNYQDLTNDPHVQATGMIATVNHSAAGPVRMPTVPIRLSDTPASIDLPPPLPIPHLRLGLIHACSAHVVVQNNSQRVIS